MTPWPIGSEELVSIALDPNSSPNQRDRAHQDLIPSIEESTRRVCSRFSGQVRNDLEVDAINHVLRRLKQYNPAEGTFAAWATRVIYHLGCDLRRRSARITDPLAQAHTGRSGEEWDATDDLPDHSESNNARAESIAHSLHEGFTAIRTALDTARWQATGLDTYAVWLFYLRLRMVTSLLSALPGDEVVAGRIADCIEGWLSWHADESDRKFRPEFERLQRCWEVVRPLVDGGSLGVVAVIERLIPVAGSYSLNQSVWNQWVNRARRAAQDHISAADWRLFARWVPNRAARSGEPTP